MKKGFTLIELLIVIAILAVLGTIAVLVINPAQMLAQARDSQRLSDMAAVRKALALYASTASTVTITASTTCTNTPTGNVHSGIAATINSSTLVTGSGWVNIDITTSLGGSPLGSLPTDPTNDATYEYCYAGDLSNKTFELNARLESTKYKAKMTVDNGNDNTCTTYTEDTCYYEVGTDPGLDLF